MSYTPKLTEKDRKVLEVIARGHPDRKLTATYHGVSTQVSALTWNEIQLALNTSFSDISDCIAHLITNDYIDTGRRQSPSFWRRVKGESETAYFWITQKGLAFLREGAEKPESSISDGENGLKSDLDDLKRVEANLKQLGYDLTPYGAGVALLSLESSYSHVETASHLALATLALDAKEAGDDITKLMALLPHARAMVDILTELKNAGLMREELFKNDARAMLKVVIVDRDQPAWIERVLCDPMIAKEHMATSRINYRQMLG